MATNETISKLTENQQETLNVEPDQLSEKETEEVVGGGTATYNISTAVSS